MPTITWDYLCNFCNRPINRGRPTILFATNKPLLLGIAHSTCATNKDNLGRYQMNPPNHLFPAQVTFLTQFYPLLHALTNVLTPNAALRQCMADFVHHFPSSIIDPMECLNRYKEMHLDKPIAYEGDLGADYIEFLARVLKAAKVHPVDIEFDFP